MVLVAKIRRPGRRRRRRRREDTRASRPKLRFYRDALIQLESLGIHREAAQTPRELSGEVDRSVQHPMVPAMTPAMEVLSRWYYQLRFGRTPSLPPTDHDGGKAATDVELMDLEDAYPAVARDEIREALSQIRSAVAAHAEMGGQSLTTDGEGRPFRHRTDPSDNPTADDATESSKL